MPFAPNLALHDVTRRVCEAYIRNHDHGLLLSGEVGCGLKTIANALAKGLNRESDGVLCIEPEEDKDISIDQIRQLYHETRAVRSTQLTVIIDDAEHMSLPAQNAFLKLLEEPPERLVFVLTSHYPHLLLETIRSRVASIEVRRISEDDSRQLITNTGINDATTISQLMFLSEGRPAGLLKLIADASYFEHRATIMRSAREIIQGSPYQRLTGLKDAMSDRDKAIEIVSTIGDLVAYGAKKGLSQQAVRQLNAISNTIDKLHANANVRLQLLALALSL